MADRSKGIKRLMMSAAACTVLCVAMSVGAGAEKADPAEDESGDIGISAYAVPLAMGAGTLALKRYINK
ncbi:MAG: hypothetical protein ACI4JJ_00550 [Huintestinicola sp.]